MLNSGSDNFVPSNSFSHEVTGEAGRIWSDCLTDLRSELDPQIFLAYIDPLRACNLDRNCSEFVLSAPSKFLCNHIDRNFRDRILKVISTKLGLETLTLRFIVDYPLNTSIDQPKALTPFVVVKKMQGAATSHSVNRPTSASVYAQDLPNPRYTFENFIVGLGNQFCHAAALRVAEEPGKSYNPLFIYGGVGLGKTHLLHAIGNSVLTKFPAKRVAYISSEAFTNELIQALRAAKMEEFKK